MGSIAKTFSLEMVGLISTQYNRREVLNYRAAIMLPGNSGLEEYMLEAGQTSPTLVIGNVILAACDGQGITCSLTKPSASPFVTTLGQTLMLFDAFSAVTFTNTNATGTDPIRIRVFWG